MANLIDNDAKIIASGGRIEGYGHPQIINTSANRLYTGHINGNDELEIHYSDNNGTDWSLDETISLPSGESNLDFFSFAKSENDDIFVTYSYGNVNNNIKVHRRHYSTGVWSEIYNVTSINADNYKIKPLMTYNRQIDRLHIFWFTINTTTDMKNDYSDNYGSSWNGVNSYELNSGEVATYYGGMDTNPTNGQIIIHLASNGAVRKVIFDSDGAYVSIATQNYNENTAVVNAVDNDGNIWYLISRTAQDYAFLRGLGVDQAIFNPQNPYKGMIALGIDASNNVYAFCTSTVDDKVYYIKYDKATSTLGSETVLSSGDGFRIGCEQHTNIGQVKLNVIYFSD